MPASEITSLLSSLFSRILAYKCQLLQGPRTHFPNSLTQQDDNSVSLTPPCTPRGNYSLVFMFITFMYVFILFLFLNIFSHSRMAK